jgi:hypothetical protein
MLHKKISLNEAVASLENDTHRLLFTWAISHLDIEGRISGSPKVFRAIVVPLLEHITAEKVAKFFKDAESKELILRYQIGKEWFIQYPKFKDNQRLRVDRESPSKLPSPPDKLCETPGGLPEDSRSNDGEVQEDSGLKFKLSLNQDNKKDMSPPTGGNGAYPQDFEAIYLAYPKNQHGSKKNAFAQFKKAKPTIPKDVISIIERQIAEKQKADSLGIFYPEFKHFERWLKAAEWEREPFDFDVAQPEGGQPQWVQEHLKAQSMS